MIKVGIVGCGFVGGALKAWLDENNKDVKVFVSDPPKGMNDDLSGIDIAFLQIHVPTEDDGTQDLRLMADLINGAAECAGVRAHDYSARNEREAFKGNGPSGLLHAGISYRTHAH